MTDKDRRTVRWGILGTARIATRVSAAIKATDGAEACAIASRTSERAAAWAAQHDVGRSYGDYESLLDDDEIEAVYVPLPPSMHAEWTIRCAKAGKHVLCEKPLAMNATEAEEMASACREHNVQLMDATMWVHHPRSEEMKNVLNERAGELRRVTSAFSFDIEPYLVNKPPHGARGPSGEVTHDAVLANELRFQRELGGGALLDLGWYNVRATLWAMGDLPERVFATARYRHGVDFNLSAMMWFSGARVASFDCGYDMSLRKWFEVVGTQGSLVCDDFLSPTDPDRPRFWFHGKPGETAEFVSPPLIQEQRMIEAFCEIVRSGKIEATWPEISIANQRVCDAIAISARSEEIVELREGM